MLETILDQWCKQHRIEPPQPEYPFAASIGRGWRFDFAWPRRMLAFEVEGVTGKGGGRHQRKEGYKKDCEKYAEALCMGWRVLRLTPKQIKEGLMLVFLERLLGVVP